MDTVNQIESQLVMRHYDGFMRQVAGFAGGVGEGMICLKSQRELETMDRANRLVHRVLRAVEGAAAPGVSTGELDKLAEEMIRADGGHSGLQGLSWAFRRPLHLDQRRHRARHPQRQEPPQATAISSASTAACCSTVSTAMPQ